MTLFAELRRRKVFKVGAAYLVVAWLLIQIAATVSPQLQLPDWAPRLITLVVMLGFPVALILAWALEVKPEGVAGKAAPVGDWRIYAIATVLVAAAIGWYFLAPGKTVSESLSSPAVSATAGPPVPESVSDTVSSSSAPQKQSIAVLAFTDLSPGKDQEYFSDGIAEEILNALVKVNGLKVAGRTSSFFYKGKNEDLRRIGETLGVAHILEGSVRKQGDRVRITAQLIQASDGFHLWSETYDGDLADVFELQERIARAITDELKVVLKGEQQQRLVPVATASTAAYALYLQATGIFNLRDYARLPDAIALLEEALRVDPDFARAHSRLATVHVAIGTKASHDAADFHARRAMELDPTLAEPHAVQGTLYAHQRRFAEQHAAFARALALEPDDISTNFWLALALLNSGYTRRGLEHLDRVLAIDPMLPNALNRRAMAYLDAGDIDAAERMARRAADAGLTFASATLSRVESARGRRDAAIAELTRSFGVARGFPFPSDTRQLIARALVGDAQAIAPALALADEYLARSPAETVPYIVIIIVLRAGQIERGQALMVGATESNQTSSILGNYIWGDGRDVRTAPEFAEFARRFGLAAWWDVNGPPDLCRKAENGDYRCE